MSQVQEPQKTAEEKQGALAELAHQANGLMVGGQANAIIQIRQGYLTARAELKPRNMQRIEESCFAEAEKFSESMYYEWSVKKKINTAEGVKYVPSIIKGPSIRAAEIILQHYENCSADAFPVAITPEHIIWAATFIDLERGVNVSRSFIMNRSTLKLSQKQMEGGSEEASRQEEVRMLAVQSRIWRAVVFAGTPRYLREGMMRLAEQKMATILQGKSLTQKREALKSEYFRLFSVPVTSLEAYVDSRFDKWKGEQCIKLIGLLTALRENPEALAETFGRTVEQFQEQPIEAPSPLSHDQQDALKDIGKILKKLEPEPANFPDWIFRATNGQARGSVDLMQKPHLIISCMLTLSEWNRKQNNE